jgi:hypothetical protein
LDKRAGYSLSRDAWDEEVRRGRFKTRAEAMRHYGFDPVEEERALAEQRRETALPPAGPAGAN